MRVERNVRLPAGRERPRVLLPEVLDVIGEDVVEFNVRMAAADVVDEEAVERVEDREMADGQVPGLEDVDAGRTVFNRPRWSA